MEIKKLQKFLQRAKSPNSKIDSSKIPILYSVGTILSYRIAKEYYHSYFVWCTSCFHSASQPPTSDPFTICAKYLQHAILGDRHSHEIEDNKSGILRGARDKYIAGIIDEKAYNIICEMVNCAQYDAFLPVLFVINTDAVKDRCKEVERSERANDNSVEYIIKDLADGEFEIIGFKELLTGLVDPCSRRAGS